MSSLQPIDVKIAAATRIRADRIDRDINARLLSVGKRTESPGRDGRLPMIKTPDFATRMKFLSITRMGLVGWPR